ncbi:MAG TPA: hypothetical protein HA348_01860 [Thermoplasmata archaeon]|nr:hypothetical protein [Thermoplasmata archaeon]
MNSNQKIEDEFFKLIGYMITSARGSIEEPKLYGPFRLVESASKTIEIMEEMGIENDFLIKAKEKIDKEKYSVMSEKKKFIKFLDELILDFVFYANEE